MQLGIQRNSKWAAENVALLFHKGEAMIVIQEKGEWLDKEPRADGKPRRWKPFEELTVDASLVFAQERKTQHPSGDIHLRDRMSK
jgi:hypothetical protein